VSNPEIWRQRIWVWLPALVFFLVNLAAFSVYKLGYAANLQSLEGALDNQSREEKTLKARQAELDTLLARAAENHRRVAELYENRFSTRRRRLTEVTAEVIDLARRSGLKPDSISYPEQEIQDYGLIKRSFIFSVTGTYLGLRKFINLLELSDSFLTLEDTTLSQDTRAAGTELHINLRLSTLFAREVREAGDEAAAPSPSSPRLPAPLPARRPGGSS
jgi:type IV pilus assembly protein PilO